MNRSAFFIVAAVVAVGLGAWVVLSPAEKPAPRNGPRPTPAAASAGSPAPAAAGPAAAAGKAAAQPADSAASSGTTRRMVTPAKGAQVIEMPREAGTPQALESAAPTPVPQPRQFAPPAPRPTAAPQSPGRIAITVLEDSGPAPTPRPENTADGRSVQRRAGGHVDEPFLPTGELVKAELINAVTSNGSAGGDTPLIARVIEDKYFNGTVVIPKGTKLHGTAGGLVGPTGAKRLRTGTSWTLVFPAFGDVANGSEIRLRGLALNRAEQPRPDSWVITDGEAGLRGMAIYDPTADKVRQWLATFGAASLAALQSTQTVTSAFGSSSREVSNTPRNAALGGLSAVAAQEVADIQQRIKDDGAFIIVPGGTAMYLYLQEAIFPVRSKIGGEVAARTQPTPAPLEVEEPRILPPPQEPQPVPSAYGRAPNNFTRQAPDPASALTRPPPQQPNRN